MPARPTPPKADPAAAPLGTERRRGTAPLLAVAVVFALWFIFLLWMALQYPAR